jgi:hypothetical protein
MMLKKLAFLESLCPCNGIHSFLKKLPVSAACLFALSASLTPAQVTITPKVPAYPFEVLAGSTRQINVDCSIRGSGTYKVTSTASMTVQAQSTDDLTKTATFQFNICANSGPPLANSTNSVIVAPDYQQAYQSQPMTLQSWVSSCVDETGT